jgi:hypothetical protein
MTDSDVETIVKTCEDSGPEQPKTRSAKATKADKLLKLLKSKRGATIEQLQAASGWQAHSVRGFLSGTVRKRMGLALDSEADSRGVRRYRIAETGKTPAQ